MIYKHKQTKSADIRRKLKSNAAKAAFDKINALNPKWELEGPSGYYKTISANPHVYITKPEWQYMQGIGKAPKAADSLDTCIIKKAKSLVTSGKEPGAVVVVVRTGETEHFTYNTKKRKFLPT